MSTNYKSRQSPEGQSPTLGLNADGGQPRPWDVTTRRLETSDLELLVQIDRALEKIDEGEYGLCEESGESIEKERLEAKPWARFCVRVQREREAREAT